MRKLLIWKIQDFILKHMFSCNLNQITVSTLMWYLTGPCIMHIKYWILSLVILHFAVGKKLLKTGPEASNEKRRKQSRSGNLYPFSAQYSDSMHSDIFLADLTSFSISAYQCRSEVGSCSDVHFGLFAS